MKSSPNSSTNEVACTSFRELPEPPSHTSISQNGVMLMTAALPYHKCLLCVKLRDDNFSCLISPHPPVTRKRRSIIMPILQRRKLRQQGKSETATVTSAGAPKQVGPGLWFQQVIPGGTHVRCLAYTEGSANKRLILQCLANISVGLVVEVLDELGRNSLSYMPCRTQPTPFLEEETRSSEGP